MRGNASLRALVISFSTPLCTSFSGTSIVRRGCSCSTIRQSRMLSNSTDVYKDALGACASPLVIPPLHSESKSILQQFGATIQPMEPLGARVWGVDLESPTPPPARVVQALEQEMASRGFLVFANQQNLTADGFLRASCWWGGKSLHSTHGVHPAAPSPHIFRLSNDPRLGIPNVGPQWHNDGSFVEGTFSHVGYHIIRPAEHGGGTHFCHQGAAFDALPPARQAFWQRLSSVNSNSGVVHPCVHSHPTSRRKSIWLHLGMTGAVIEMLPNEQPVDKTTATGKQEPASSFRLLNIFEMKQLFHEYNDLLNAGFQDRYAVNYEYQPGDCIFMDNLAVAHRASPNAHMPPELQGVRILHRSTVHAVQDFAPSFGLPQTLDIHGTSPFGPGVWQGGGIGFCWDESLPFHN